MRLYVHSNGSEEPQVVEVDGTVLVSDFLVQVGTDWLWVEDVDVELDGGLSLEAQEVVDLGHVHASRCRKVEVSVRYGGETKERSFAPSARIHRVAKWATGPEGFNLSAAEAEKHVLALRGSEHRVPERVHVGSLSEDGACVLELDLRPKIRHEG